MQKKAVALKYECGDNAPKVVALGKGEIAEKILSLASEKGVPILSKPVLVDKLIELELQQEVPPELYEVVAEVLAFIYKLSKKEGSI
ncbi:MAG: flagellar biosynthesis protein [Clostridia bacterium]|jgi:flagellar biosynthesis protein|nr:flagellar biosynthesis protein [Clostridia bacterium]MDN5323966.1 flagellar biosynthesis protein [Clostridia bacterium]